MKNIVLFLVLFPILLYPYTDESHYSKTFGIERFFRVFTPLNYDAQKIKKKYSVIYYFHGCGGSYKKSGTYSYQDFDLIPPNAEDRQDSPDYDFPNNADFENEATSKDVIIIAVDGKIPGIPGCGVYFPSQVDDWDGNGYNFSAYIRELIHRVTASSHFRTLNGGAGGYLGGSHQPALVQQRIRVWLFTGVL